MMKQCKIILRAYSKFMKEIWDDIIFAALFFIPIFVGLIFHFGIPALEKELCEMQQVEQIIRPFYIAFDLCIIMMTPIMFSFAGVMVILGELDNGMARYLMVTPLSKSGYLWSRIGVISVIAMIYGWVITIIFRISNISVLQILFQGVIAALIGVLISFMVIAIAHNKVEGMALTKFSSFFILGIPISIFLKGPIKYLGFFLPTFWSTEYVLYGHIHDAIIGIAVGIILCSLGYYLFSKKIK